MTGLVQGLLIAGAASLALIGSMVSGDTFGNLGVLVSLAIAVGGGMLVGLAIGFFSWFVTRFVIDATEVRVTRGLVSRSSRRIPFERIQSVDVAEPFIARLVGLAELRIDSAGGSESRTTLRYLPLPEVRELRRVLLARAHGTDPDTAVEPVDEARSLITRVPPQRVIIGTLLSLDFVALVAGLVAIVAAALWFEQLLVALGGAFSLGSALVQLVARRIVQQWDFTLSRGDHGLRIERGLLSRTSQTIPFDRVQGVAVKEPIIWRRFGWQRLEVDVAGYASQRDESKGPGNETLLPITDPVLAAAVIDELLPPGDALPEDRLAAARAEARAWPLAPIGWRFRTVAVSTGRLATTRGWLSRTTALVPHVKNQSVEVRQGPLQRWRGVATVEVHTPPGPVDADADLLDATLARRLLVEQVERVRTTS